MSRIEGIKKKYNDFLQAKKARASIDYYSDNPDPWPEIFWYIDEDDVSHLLEQLEQARKKAENFRDNYVDTLASNDKSYEAKRLKFKLPWEAQASD